MSTAAGVTRVERPTLRTTHCTLFTLPARARTAVHGTPRSAPSCRPRSVAICQGEAPRDSPLQALLRPGPRQDGKSCDQLSCSSSEYQRRTDTPHDEVHFCDTAHGVVLALSTLIGLALPGSGAASIASGAASTAATLIGSDAGAANVVAAQQHIKHIEGSAKKSVQKSGLV